MNDKNHQKQQRLALMQQAKGMWADRQDLPNLEDLRHEFDRCLDDRRKNTISN
jgi:hypothetical protein